MIGQLQENMPELSNARDVDNNGYDSDTKPELKPQKKKTKLDGNTDDFRE